MAIVAVSRTGLAVALLVLLGIFESSVARKSTATRSVLGVLFYDHKENQTKKKTQTNTMDWINPNTHYLSV